VQYVYLDTDERRRFAQASHEYLIQQVQFTGAETLVGSSGGSANKFKMNFNHPTKFLIWVCRKAEAETAKNWFNFTTTGTPSTLATTFAGVNPVSSALIQLNGHDRMSAREGKYFNYLQPYMHFENVPGEGINVYSFALKPHEHQPSGTCNFSRIDSAILQLTATYPSTEAFTSGSCLIFAYNYNVLRIMSGIAIVLVIYKSLTITRINPSCAEELFHKKEIVSLFNQEKATILNCGNFLKVLTTIFIKKFIKRTRLTVVSNSKNVRNWKIRNQDSLNKRIRFRDYNKLGLKALRYSPTIFERKYRAYGEALLIVIEWFQPPKLLYIKIIKIIKYFLTLI
jgi:hypothetical protein